MFLYAIPYPLNTDYLPRGKSAYDLRYLLDSGGLNEDLQGWEHPHIVTLNFLAMYDREGWIFMDYSPASRLVSEFHEDISFRLQYPSKTRAGDKIKFLPIVEWGVAREKTARPGVRAYRCLIECPDEDMLQSLSQIVDSAWDTQIMEDGLTNVTQCESVWVDKLIPPSSSSDLIYSIDWDGIKLQ